MYKAMWMDRSQIVFTIIKYLLSMSSARLSIHTNAEPIKNLLIIIACALFLIMDISQIFDVIIMKCIANKIN